MIRPESFKYALDKVLSDAKVDVLLYTQVIEANKINGNIESITCIDDRGKFTITSSSFVDANGDANLTAMAGRTIDCDTLTFVSIRVTGTAMATGHTAGAAAAIYSNTNSASPDEVRHELIKQNALI
ncbi:FAD-dependent oxidoreductase [Clostridium sp. P21]|uniref:FAD-dependent oxidoreductase n=1 Tax=Clostridium muellerianum TaxID=2716538 RepID=A0A7Y0EID1_9CLOT|nr:FAD-dependent oxidoreductase [Clostridium muellerianum]NMM62950.1 FAD-dependent oxidoreductase [Clostridium muellerianum]